VKANDKSSQGSSFSGFGASSFPGNFKSKDFEIHDSSIGKTASAEEETLPLLDPHLPCPEARHRLLTERTQQYPEHVKHYGASSPLKKSNSFFETSCGLVQEKPNTFGSFPESNHASSALQLVNNIRRCDRLSPMSQRNLIRNSSH
jgi:hypothetical protein